MSGNRIGGLKNKKKNLSKDPDFYGRIGAEGGKKRRPTKGFGYDRRTWWQKLWRVKSVAQIAGKRGGSAPRRRKQS